MTSLKMALSAWMDLDLKLLIQIMTAGYKTSSASRGVCKVVTSSSGMMTGFSILSKLLQSSGKNPLKLC